MYQKDLAQGETFYLFARFSGESKISRFYCRLKMLSTLYFEHENNEICFDIIDYNHECEYLEAFKNSLAVWE